LGKTYVVFLEQAAVMKYGYDWRTEPTVWMMVAACPPPEASEAHADWMVLLALVRVALEHLGVLDAQSELR
jgi:hypothetical protein